MNTQIKIPITIRWNEARQQWDVLFLGGHLQEFNEDTKEIPFFECATVKSFVKKLNLRKDRDNKKIFTVY